MFLIYQEDQQLVLNRFLEEFNKNVTEIGAVLQVTQFKKI